MNDKRQAEQLEHQPSVFAVKQAKTEVVFNPQDNTHKD